MNQIDFLNQLQASELTVCQPFFLKDVYTDGLATARRLATRPVIEHSMDILAGYTLLDEAEDEATGRPVRDYYLWTALATYLINAGDISSAAVVVKHAYAGMAPLTVPGEWVFGYDLPDTTFAPFLKLLPVDPAVVTQTLVSEALLKPYAEHDVPYKSMGSIDPTKLDIKVQGYPLSVHPKMQRPICWFLTYQLLGALVSTGLQILEHWQPKDTSQHPGVYYLSDGADAYVVIFDAPMLRDCLIDIDQRVGRTEEDGAIVADAQPAFAAATSIEASLSSALDPTAAAIPGEGELPD